ncbi:E3 ubiquitin-protein ligase RFWD2 [Morus notabilis]|uniref:E3 ubiquitin-protein ligase RFWD2 n=1 Tax=Morus notabilis TaxID=981085 RepID=W9SL93_9ROSA|nr:E3 ubiquitin-protein ligase RFWD2 [Morus notabilis]
MDSGESSERRDAKGKRIVLDMDLIDLLPGEIMDISSHPEVEVEGQGNGNSSRQAASSVNVTGDHRFVFFTLHLCWFNQLGDLYESPHDKRAITMELKIYMKNSISHNIMNQDIATDTLVPPPVAPPSVAPPPVAPSPVPKPTFKCGICLDQIVEATSTTCGHIFCKKCVEAAIASQNICPACHHKLLNKDTRKVHLPEPHYLSKKI